nr:hypothetical protein GCM10020093_022710 [Planobispora longispora]
MKITATHIGTATVLLEIGGLRLLTDPVFDPAPAEFDYGPVVLRSTAGPAIEAGDLPPIDAVLLSHDEHYDNLDTIGRTLLDGRPVMTTVSGAGRLGGEAVGLEPWATRELTVGGTTLRVTGTPGLHGPFGDVTGFVVEEPGRRRPSTSPATPSTSTNSTRSAAGSPSAPPCCTWGPRASRTSAAAS